MEPWLSLLPLPGDGPAYRALAGGIRAMAMDGRLTDGTRLPSERTLARALGLSRTTVTRAYADLAETGWATARRGSGTTIHLPGGVRSPSLPLVPGVNADALDLSAAAGLAPSATAALVTEALEWLPSLLRGAGYEPYGAAHLRERIAAWYEARGLPTSPGQVIVTPGALAALNVALHALAGPGRRVLVDTPTYPGGLGAVEAAGARPVGVPLAGDWDLAAWAAAARRSRPAAAYLIPDHHNPTGQVMPAADREQLAAVLRQAGATPVVDETLVELNFDRPAEVPYARLDPSAVTVGSLSKVLWGGVRIGWLRCPDDLLGQVRATAVRLALGASTLDQLVASSFFDQPGPVRAEVRAALLASRERWLAELAAVLPQWRPNRPEGGLALWVELPRRTASELALVARGHGLALAPGPLFSVDRTHRGHLRLPLTLPADLVGEATARLAAAWQDLPATDGAVGVPSGLAL